MSKWFEVQVTTVTVFAVEVEDSEGVDEAMEYVQDEVSLTGNVTIECGPEIVDEIEIARTQRHADEVLEREEQDG